MIVPAYSSFTQWYLEGRERSYVRAAKSPGGILDLLETRRPAGDMHRPAMSDLVLYQDLVGGKGCKGGSGQLTPLAALTSPDTFRILLAPRERESGPSVRGQSRR